MRKVLTRPTPGHPYDDGIYQALTVALPTPTVTEPELPAFCCRERDMNTSGECRRTRLVMTLHTDFAEITRERARVQRGRLREDRTRNLIGWVEFAERRLRHYLATWELPECTGAPARRFAEPVRDIETALPVCTC